MNGEAEVREAAEELARRVPLVGSADLLDLVATLVDTVREDDQGRGFRGTPVAQLSPVQVISAAERPPVRDLMRSLQQALADHDQEDQLSRLAGYTGGLLGAWSDFRAGLPSLDLHGLAMVMLGPVTSTQPPSEAWDAVAFAWLHGVVHGGPPPADWVREAASRRSLRLAHSRYDTAATAVCEVELPSDFLDRLVSGSPGVQLGRERVVQQWESRSRHIPDAEDAMATRIAGLDHVERLDWGSEIDEDLAIGHLVGWLMRYDVVVDSPTFLASAPYAGLVVEHRAKGLVQAHHQALREMWDEVGLAVPLVIRLALLAWALDQAQERVPMVDVVRSKPVHGRVRLQLPRVGE